MKYKLPSNLSCLVNNMNTSLSTRDPRSDRWIDYLTAYSFDISAIYHSLITRMKGNPHRLMDQLMLKSNNLLNLEPKIKKYLLGLSPYTKLDYIFQELVNSYGLTPAHVKLFTERYLWVNFKGEQLFQFLEGNKIKIKVKMLRGSYELIVFVTQGMIEAYGKFGDVVHVSFNFVPVKRNRLMRTQYIGVFSGVNYNGDMIIFGIALIVGSSPAMRAQSILQFFNLMRPLRPVTLISQYSHSIRSLITTLNKTRAHKIHYFQNWHHTLQNLQKQLLPEPSRKQIMHILKKLLLSFSKSDINSLQQKIRRLTTQPFTKKVIHSILQNTMSYCCKQQPGFVAFEIQANRAIFIGELVQEEIGFCDGLGRFVYEGLQLEKKVNLGAYKVRRVSKEEILKVSPQGGLRIIASCISQDVFKKLVYNFHLSKTSCQLQTTQKSNKVKVLQIPPSKQRSSSQSETQIQPDQYIITYNIKTQCWQCQCNMIYWAGIPCSHLICTILHFGGSIQYYVNQRWLWQEWPGTTKNKKSEKVQMEKEKDKEQEDTSDKRDKA